MFEFSDAQEMSDVFCNRKKAPEDILSDIQQALKHS